MTAAVASQALSRGVKYLVCVDKREESRVALRLAYMKAKARGHQVNILHVITPGDFQTIGTVAERMREEQQKEGQKLLDTLAENAMSVYGLQPTTLLREGTVGDEIVATLAEDPNINMLVIGVAHQSSGRGKVTAWIAGQLGNKIFVPVMMIPGNLTDQQLQGLI